MPLVCRNLLFQIKCLVLIILEQLEEISKIDHEEELPEKPVGDCQSTGSLCLGKNLSADNQPTVSHRRPTVGQQVFSGSLHSSSQLPQNNSRCKLQVAV